MSGFRKLEMSGFRHPLGPGGRHEGRAGVTLGGEQIDADRWFSDWERGGVLREEARHFFHWDQTLTLLWFESEEVPSKKRERRRWDQDSCDVRDDEEELGLQELDGNLRWTSKQRNR